jgi:hypothetical protein
MAKRRHGKARATARLYIPIIKSFMEYAQLRKLTFYVLFAAGEGLSECTDTHLVPENTVDGFFRCRPGAPRIEIGVKLYYNMGIVSARAARSVLSAGAVFEQRLH